MLGYGAYVVFFEFCKQAFPEIGDQMVARMVAGMDVTMYRPDDELKKLAALAVELDLADLFVEGNEPAQGAQRAGGARRRRSALARRAGGGQGSLVQRVGRGRLLPPPPVLGRRPDRAVRRPASLRRADPRRRGPHPPDRATGPGAGADRRRVPGTARQRRREGRLRPDARPVPPGLPLHRVAQVLLRALVHHPVLPEDPRLRPATGRPRRAGRGRGRVPPAARRGRGRPRRRACWPGRPAAASWAPGTGSRSSPSASEIVAGAGRLVAAAGARPGSRGAERPCGADAVGRHRRDGADLAGRRRARRERRPRLRGLAGRRRGHRARAGKRQRDRLRSARARSSSAR